MGTLEWPKNFSKDKKKATPLERATLECHRALHPGPSTLRALFYYNAKSPPEYSREIGRGLFSLHCYKKNDDIVDFVGVYMTLDEYDKLCQREPHRVGYALEYTDSIVLDCFDHYRMGFCVASLANSPIGCWNTVTKSKAVANCRLIVHHDDNIHKRRVYLKAGPETSCPKNFFIPAGTEILFNYTSPSYDYNKPPCHP
jgi:hypothetical protein